MARGSTFSDPDVKAEMLELRLKGYSYVELAKKYRVDHTTIIYHCQVAGLTVSRDVRDTIFGLIKQGFSKEQVIEQLKISGTVVDFYCYRYGQEGTKIFGRTNLHLEPVAPRTPKIIKDQVTPPTKAIQTRIDDRGVEWRDDGHGGWICNGKSEKQYKQEANEKKKKDLEKKRLAMLSY